MIENYQAFSCKITKSKFNEFDIDFDKLNLDK